MSLTLFFIVLSLAIGYLLYDTFKKSRQKNNKTSETVNNRLKINYTNECTVLNTLSKQRIDSIKTKTISIHFIGDQIEPLQQDIIKCKQILTKILNNRRVYLLQKKNHQYNRLFFMVKQVIGPQYTIPYNSLDGAVAILRQLQTGTSGLHLESERQLYDKIKQYIHKVWLVGEDIDQQALRQFKTETQLLKFLANLQSLEQEDTK